LKERRLPAEWAPQTGVLLCWPTSRTDWAANLADAESDYLALTAAIARFEDVHVCCQDRETRRHVKTLLDVAGMPTDRCHLHVVPYDDTWVRDYGPITVLANGAPAWLNFRFNAWGGKYPHGHDDAFTRLLHAAPDFKAIPLHDDDLVLEGGSIDGDGRGTLLTTSRCLLSPGRNPALDRTDIEQRLRDALGIERVLWLQHGRLEGDDTDAHIDTLARFCSPDTIAYTRCHDPSDPHDRELGLMEQELKSLRQSNGEPYRLVPLPLPTPCHNQQGRRLPATYANFLVVDGAVLAPQYGVATDDAAVRQLQTAFPDRKVVGVPCRALIEQFGSLHCVTMQLPAAMGRGNY